MEPKFVNKSYFKQLFQNLRPKAQHSKNRIFVTSHFGTLLGIFGGRGSIHEKGHSKTYSSLQFFHGIEGKSWNGVKPPEDFRGHAFQSKESAHFRGVETTFKVEGPGHFGNKLWKQ